MNIDVAMFADSVVVDAVSGLFTITGGGGSSLVVDHVPAQRRLMLAVQFTFTKGEFNKTYVMAVQVRERSGQICGELSADLTVIVPEEYTRRTTSTQLALAIDNVSLPRLGEYEVRISINGTVIKKQAFCVDLSTPGPFASPVTALVA